MTDVASTPLMNAAAVEAVEQAVGDLVKQINTGMSPDQVAHAIGEHTKAIIARTTAESRGRLNSLFTALQAMDELLKESDVQLKTEIDRHVDISNKSARVSTMVLEAVTDWQKQVKFRE